MLDDDDRKRVFAVVDELWKRNKDVDPEQVEKDIDEAIKEVRREAKMKEKEL